MIYDNEHYLDVYDYDSQSWHKNITTVDAAISYDSPQTGDTSVFHFSKTILIPTILHPTECNLNNALVNYIPNFPVKNWQCMVTWSSSYTKMTLCRLSIYPLAPVSNTSLCLPPICLSLTGRIYQISPWLGPWNRMTLSRKCWMS